MTDTKSKEPDAVGELNSRLIIDRLESRAFDGARREAAESLTSLRKMTPPPKGEGVVIVPARELDRLRRFVDFVNLWVNRENVSDRERVSVIKHHPVARAALKGAPDPNDLGVRNDRCDC